MRIYPTRLALALFGIPACLSLILAIEIAWWPWVVLVDGLVLGVLLLDALIGLPLKRQFDLRRPFERHLKGGPYTGEQNGRSPRKHTDRPPDPLLDPRERLPGSTGHRTLRSVVTSFFRVGHASSCIVMSE